MTDFNQITRLYGDPLVNADQSGTRLYTITTPDVNKVLSGVRARFIYFNAPTATSLNMKLYTCDGVEPGLLLATSTSKAYSEIQAAPWYDDYGFFETWFPFPTFPTMKASVPYAFVVNGVWNFSDSSYIAWTKDYPDSPYFEDSTKYIATGPFHIRPVTARL